MKDNFHAYMKFDESKYKGKYLVFIKGRLFKAGKNLLKIIQDVKDKYPKEIPLVVKPLTGETYILHDHF